MKEEHRVRGEVGELEEGKGEKEKRKVRKK